MTKVFAQVTSPVQSSGGLKPFHSKVYEQLRKFVYKSMGIRLQLMPQQSTRHTFNRTRFNRNLGVVSWSIEFVFYLAAAVSAEEPIQKKFFRFNTKNFIFSSKNLLKQVSFCVGIKQFLIVRKRKVGQFETFKLFCLKMFA